MPNINLCACTQIAVRMRATSQAAIAHPAPVKKPTQNQTPIRWRLMVEGMFGFSYREEDC
jgi:hypothetical protein